MLAFVGVLVPTLGINVPGYPVEPDWTQALQKAAVQNPLGMAQIMLAIGIIEVRHKVHIYHIYVQCLIVSSFPVSRMVQWGVLMWHAGRSSRPSPPTVGAGIK